MKLEECKNKSCTFEEELEWVLDTRKPLNGDNKLHEDTATNSNVHDNWKIDDWRQRQ